MSAICGIYYYDDRTIAPDVSEAMMRRLKTNHIDASGKWEDGPLFLGCHAQHITPESLTEVLPYHDEAAGLTITADVILDNRIELFQNINIDHSRRSSMPDSVLILKAYQKWGQDCLKYLVGDFAFVIWDENRRELFCAVDHTGSRTFYYYQSKEFFAFSTLIKPLFALPEIGRKHNETWFADFLAIPSVQNHLDAELTTYQDIYMLVAGTKLTVRPNSLKKERYWQVIPQQELKLKSDSEYDEAFREVFGDAVRSCMRSHRPTGVMMSGGLDSTAVAALAAQSLASEDKRLQVFSSVPIAGYRDWLPPTLVADETPYVEAVQQHVGNIDVTYCSLEGKHSFSETERLLSIMEQPYKVVENLFWIDGIVAAAKKQNMGVLLHGSTGNMTISWGDVLPYLLYLSQSGQWYSFLGQLWDRAKRYNHRYRAAWHLFSGVLPPYIPNLVSRIKTIKGMQEISDLSPINPDFYHQYGLTQRLKNFGYDQKIQRKNSLEIRVESLQAGYFSQLSVPFTKLSLYYGIAVRDPSRDKRVIEFCLSLPENQFVRNGRDRLIIRRAMQGLLPDKVCYNDVVRGQQSADLAQRLQAVWPVMKEEIRRIGDYQEEKKYLDIDKIKKHLVRCEKIEDEQTGDPGFRMLIRSLIFSRYLQQEMREMQVGNKIL